MRLIDADDLCKVMMHEYSDSARICGGIAALIANQPTIDAVEVVRCKDCRFYLNSHLCLYFSRYGTIPTKSDDYCSIGKRREQDG